MTTGLDAKTDEVIELGMVKFAYCPDGRVAHVINSFGSSNELAKSIANRSLPLYGYGGCGRAASIPPG
jgi:DNA polymerase-3 subunit epsilon